MKENLPNLKSRIAVFIMSIVCLGSLVGPMSAIAISPEKTTNSDISEDLTDDSDNEIPDNPDESDDPEDESYEFSTSLIIHAINPGYKIDDVSDVGELIELRNLSDATISLAGFSLRYTNGSGKQTTLIQFAEGTLMAGEYLLMRYAKSPEKDGADTIYSTGLAMTTGPLELIYDDEVIDSVCWTGKENCVKSFKSANPTTLVRDLITGEFIHVEEYTPNFDPSSPSLVLPPGLEDAEDELSEEKPAAKCRGLEITEIFSYYAESQTEQFIELHNASPAEIELSSCTLRYKNKDYNLEGTISADGYFAYYPNGKFSLTKNPTSSNVIQLIDADLEVIDEAIYSNGQKKSMSYAKFFDENGTEKWLQTYSVTPGYSNEFQEFKTCPLGKAINPATGNCVNVTSLSATVKECGEGKYLNPLTNRCKTIETATELKPCAEGYERNPETNRCRKITTENTGAEYALIPNTRSDKTIFIAFGIVALIVTAGIGYITLQFRHEIARAARKLSQRLYNVRHNLLTRSASRDRNKKS